MDKNKVQAMLQQTLIDITDEKGQAAVERFWSLRDVDAKVREVKMVLGAMPEGVKVVQAMENDGDFAANSRRIRLETLANYCRTALKLLATGVIKTEATVFPPPDLRRITAAVPDLEIILDRRWVEAQSCRSAGAHLSAVVMMGSILEGLLLARANMSPAEAYTCPLAPKTREGRNLPIQDWNLGTLIDVSVQLGWLKADRGKFSHALRESRNIVHPWAQLAVKADFDLATCDTCWHVLRSSVDDLLKSVR